MTTVEQIETAILQLPPKDFQRLAAWLQQLDQERWDDDLAHDVAAGKLDALAEEAVRDFKAGRFRTR
jgi:hypothetical protein